MLSVQGNIEVPNPFEKTRKTSNKSIIRKFGLGLKIDSLDPQELFSPPVEEEDLTDYEF